MNPTKKIILTGPESTGKSTLCKQLADEFQTTWIPEYAREYIEKLERPYTYDDLVIIAENQRDIFYQSDVSKHKFIFFDTGLLLTKVWFNEVYRSIPKWIDPFLKSQKNTFYLLCKPDIEWKYDRVRENGGAKRIYLYNIYKHEILKYKFPFYEIEGNGLVRVELAKKHVNEIMKTK